MGDFYTLREVSMTHILTELGCMIVWETKGFWYYPVVETPEVFPVMSKYLLSTNQHDS